MEEIPRLPIRKQLIEILSISQKSKDECTYEEQCYLIYVAANTLISKSNLSNRKNITDENYSLNEKQKNLLNEIDSKIKDGDIISAYYKIIEFIEANIEDLDKIYKIEADQIKDKIIKLKEIIKKNIDIDLASENIIDKLNIDSDMVFYLVEGSKLLNNGKGYKEIIIAKNVLNINLAGVPQMFFAFNEKDKEFINNIKNVIIKYKKEIYKYSNEQQDKNIPEKIENMTERIKMLRYVSEDYRQARWDLIENECHGDIDGLGFDLQYKYTIDISSSTFYNNFKNELFKMIYDETKKRLSAY